MLGNIVRYNFYALDDADMETYSLDYAIVLDKDDKSNMTKILPITNRYNKESIESFCIGAVPGFVEINNEGYVNNNQYVHYDKMIDVSAEDLYPVHVQDLYGEISKDEAGKPIHVKLDKNQLEKVLDRFGIYESGEERNLLNLLVKSHPMYMIPDDHDVEAAKKVCAKKMDRYREYNFNDKKIIVFFVDGERYSIIMKPTDNEDIELRNNKIKEILN